MNFFTKEWYQNGCRDLSEDQRAYYLYFHEHKASFPEWYPEFSFHDSIILKSETKQNGSENCLNMEILHNISGQVVYIELLSPVILENCELAGKSIIADELYTDETRGYAFHILLADDNNDLYYFTLQCADILKKKPESLTLYSLYDYAITEDEYPEEIFFYDRISKAFVTEEDVAAEERNAGRFVLPPRFKKEELLHSFLKEIQSGKIDTYLAKFPYCGKKRSHAEHEILFCLGERVYKRYGGDFEYYCLSVLKPVAEQWGAKNRIPVNTDLVKPENYVLDRSLGDKDICVPTDGIKIREFINYCTEKDAYLSLKTYLCFYRNQFPNGDADFLKLPFEDEDDIRTSFLDSQNLTDIKEELLKEENFDGAFSAYIDYNEEFDHSLFDKYFDFRYSCLREILLNWCAEHSVKYVDCK